MTKANYFKDIKLDAKPLTWCRVDLLNYDGGFYFRCHKGHLSLLKPPMFEVSNIKGFEGTVKKEVICRIKDCGFRSFIMLDGWRFNFA